MKTVKEMALAAGVTVRTLHHYDAVGLLKPTRLTEAGYRLYDAEALERLRFILLFRELDFSLQEIRQILDGPEDRRMEILSQQVELLQHRRTRLNAMEELVRGIRLTGGTHMNLSQFDPDRLGEDAIQAEALYGKTDAYREYRQKSGSRSSQENAAVNAQVPDFFVRLGQLKELAPDSAPVQAWVEALRSYFTTHYYNCTPQILLCLGQMYADGGSMTGNIDAAGGPGTGAFAREAICCYCKACRE